MIRTGCLKAVAVVAVFAACMAGCSKKQEQQAGAPQGKAVNIPLKPATAVPDKDKDEARAAAEHVLQQLLAGSFAKVYADASPGFKQIGPETAFVGKFQQARKKTGELKNPREMSFNLGPQHSYVLIYRTENDRFRTDWRISFTRSSASGKLELAGLNQHDEPKK